MKTCAVLQCSYLPWCGYFDQINKADVFVVYDDVQFSKGAWQNRNRVKTPQGIQWLTVPVLTAKQNRPPIKDVIIDSSDNWARKHLKSIQQNYSKTPFFDDYFSVFEEIYSKEWKYLIDIDMAFIRTLIDQLGVESEIRFSSELGTDKNDRVRRLIDICEMLGANEFLEGNAGKSYLAGEGEQLFAQNGIKLTYHDYQHPTYRQPYGEFVPFLSVIDLLFNCGDKSLSILTSKREGVTL